MYSSINFRNTRRLRAEWMLFGYKLFVSISTRKVASQLFNEIVPMHSTTNNANF